MHIKRNTEEGKREMTALRLALYRALFGRAHDERGDVPGWVMITVMTAALVGAIWAFAGDRLQSMLEAALNSVGG
jgi:hypothetical protein